MILDCRIYTFTVGSLPGYLKLYKEKGLPTQQSHLGKPVVFHTSIVGQLHRLVHVWSYSSVEDRERRRAALESDPRWLAFVREAGQLGVILNQENMLLRAALDTDAIAELQLELASWA